jgi:nucleoside-diphosphate-sugar epimerase
MKPLKVVVTGASGFLGTCVLRELAAQQHVETIAVTRREISGWCTVRDYSQSPVGDVLIHLAEDNDRAQVAKAGRAYEEKVLATLDALLGKEYRRVIYASSAVLYGDADTLAHLSNGPIRSDDAYARIKRLSELEVLKLSGGVVVRLANIYGPRMSQNNVLSTILRQIPGTGPLEVMHTNPVRDFIWVQDAAEGIVALALGQFKIGTEGGLYNLGTGVGTSIGALANMALEVAGQNDRPVKSKSSSGRPSCLILDSSDTTSACGWKPKTSLQQGLTHLLTRIKEKV